jgi:hypothetical protein
MIFKSAFRKEGIPVTILCSPSVYSFYDPHKWWRIRKLYRRFYWNISK